MAEIGTNDVFNKLSRILETHELTSKNVDIDDMDMEKLVKGFDSARPSEKSKAAKSKKNEVTVQLPNRPRPYEVWEAKQEKNEFLQSNKPSTKLSSSQITRMVNKMHSTNKQKHEEAIRVQNEGLKDELRGYQFAPRINKVSLGLAATMKPISERMQEMAEEKNRMLAKKRQEKLDAEAATCAFKPTRMGARMSDKYLKKMGRSHKASPEDFFLYHEEKLRRNEQRRSIIENIESREMVFSPNLPETSRKLHESMMTNPANKITYDPVSRTTKVVRNFKPVIKRQDNGDSPGYGLDESFYSFLESEVGDEDLVEGPPLVLESEHPYRHNTNEYTTVAVPGAVSYTITFDEQTSTEPVHDYVRFLKFDDQSVTIGAGKYSGGMMDDKLASRSKISIVKDRAPTKTSHNWPGLGSREALEIPAAKFVVHFKTNAAISDWGFRMRIVPTIQKSSVTQGQTFKPEISARGASFSASKRDKDTSIHDRLYKEAVDKRHDSHNLYVANLQSKVNVSLNPWEQERKKPNPGTGEGGGPMSWTANKTHTGKSLLGPALNDLLIFDGDHRPIAMCEYGDISRGLWEALHVATVDYDILAPDDDYEEIDDGAGGAFDLNKMKVSDF